MKVYLDNNATTQIDPRVLEAMRGAFEIHFGNPASISHGWGWAAEELVKIAREELSQSIGATSKEVIFTSSATESISMLFQGIRHLTPKRVLCSTIEHKAVLDNGAALERYEGFELVTIPVDRLGRLKLNVLQSALKTPSALVSIIAANNEIGTIQDLKEISNICKKADVPLHLDLTQAFGKIAINFKELDCQFASISAHKIYGPKGVGAFICGESSRSSIRPILLGGGHELGLRSGTLNVPGIVGLGKAAKFVTEDFGVIRTAVTKLADKLLNGLRAKIPSLSLNGDPANRIIGNLNLLVPGIKASRIMSKLASSVAISSTSACVSHLQGTSHVLKAIGLSKEDQECSIRIGVGRFNTEAEIEFALAEMVRVVSDELSD